MAISGPIKRQGKGTDDHDDDLRLAADFAPATYDDWRKLVDGVLKGAPFEKLVGKTYDGIRIDPIYPRAKGASPVMGRAAAAPWQIMQRIDHPDAEANAQALHDLENGATGLEFGSPAAVAPAASGSMRREAVAPGLDGIFLDAGMRWRSDRPAVENSRRKSLRRYNQAARHRPRQGDFVSTSMRSAGCAPWRRSHCGGAFVPVVTARSGA